MAELNYRLNNVETKLNSIAKEKFEKYMDPLTELLAEVDKDLAEH